MTTTDQGSVGLGAAIAYFTANGYIVSVPLNDNQGYDLVVDKGFLNRVQVKTTGYREKGSKFYTVQLRSTRPNKNVNKVKKFDASKCDLLFVLDIENNKYLIPAFEVDGRSTCVLGVKAEKWKISGCGGVWPSPLVLETRDSLVQIQPPRL